MSGHKNVINLTRRAARRGDKEDLGPPLPGLYILLLQLVRHWREYIEEFGLSEHRAARNEFLLAPLLFSVVDDLTLRGCFGLAIDGAFQDCATVSGDRVVISRAADRVVRDSQERGWLMSAPGQAKYLILTPLGREHLNRNRFEPVIWRRNEDGGARGLSVLDDRVHRIMSSIITLAVHGAPEDIGRHLIGLGVRAQAIRPLHPLYDLDKFMPRGWERRNYGLRRTGPPRPTPLHLLILIVIDEWQRITQGRRVPPKETIDRAATQRLLVFAVVEHLRENRYLGVEVDAELRPEPAAVSVASTAIDRALDHCGQQGWLMAGRSKVSPDGRDLLADQEPRRPQIWQRGETDMRDLQPLQWTDVAQTVGNFLQGHHKNGFISIYEYIRGRLEFYKCAQMPDPLYIIAPSTHTDSASRRDACSPNTRRRRADSAYPPEFDTGRLRGQARRHLITS